jgi:hypothetical protein
VSITPVKRIKDPDHLGNGELWRIELSERRRALNQGDLGPPHPRQLKLCLRDLVSALKSDCIIGVAGNFAGELVYLFCNCRGGGDV